MQSSKASAISAKLLDIISVVFKWYTACKLLVQIINYKTIPIPVNTLDMNHNWKSCAETDNGVEANNNIWRPNNHVSSTFMISHPDSRFTHILITCCLIKWTAVCRHWTLYQMLWQNIRELRGSLAQQLGWCSTQCRTGPVIVFSF